MFAVAEKIADAVLYEGYVLYPYRASAVKNQFRWQFGVLAPEAPGGDGEPSVAQTECLIEREHTPSSGNGVAGAGVPLLSVRARFLRPQRADGPEAPNAWLHGALHVCDIGPLDVSDLAEAPCTIPLPAGGVNAVLALAAECVDGFIRVRIRLENREPWRNAFGTDRDAMLRRSLAGAHLLLALQHGAFVSLLEPPAQAASLAAACANRHTWPVLVGERRDRHLMLSSPIVLYDYPAVANASRGDLCDAAEIDEILSLRIMTMTDAEKAEARATDPRARAIVDRVETLTAADMAAMHGIVQAAEFFNPAGTAPPDQEWVVIGRRKVAKGSRVRLHPNRRADSMDMFLKDQDATVAGVYRDVDERVHVAVTVNCDPAASLHESFGRYFYFDPTEIEPLDQELP